MDFDTLAIRRTGSITQAPPDEMDFQDLTDQLNEYEKAINERIEVF